MESKKCGLASAHANVLQQEYNSTLKIKAEMKAQQLEMSIMEKDLGTLTHNFSKEYFIKKKQKIFKK